jgi:hypothetical protein
MVSTRSRRWQDVINLLLGIWLFISPWVIGFRSSMPDNSWNFYVVGGGFILFALLGLATRWILGEWVNLALGIWLIVAPWILFFNEHHDASGVSIGVGAVATVLSIWMLGQRHVRPVSGVRADHSLSR